MFAVSLLPTPAVFAVLRRHHRSTGEARGVYESRGKHRSCQSLLQTCVSHNSSFFELWVDARAKPVQESDTCRGVHLLCRWRYRPKFAKKSEMALVGGCCPYDSRPVI